MTESEPAPSIRYWGEREREGREELIGTSLLYLYGGDKVMRVRQVRRGGPPGESQLHLLTGSGRLPSLRRRRGKGACDGLGRFGLFVLYLWPA